MIEKQLEDIAYQLRTNKEDGQPGAIVFLGAGVSVTAGIPPAGKITEEILEKFKDSPDIQKLTSEEHSYVNVMSCLTPAQRKKLLTSYIDNAKINIAHIYLAQLMHEGYVDYIVTVNFDNLTLRALSFFNEFPATYDISILNEITTSSLDKPAVIFMHGQHHGFWLLNTAGEMNKIQTTAPVIFNKIAQERTWIVIGYGATDPVFDHLVNLGRFVNRLFWISYKDNEPASHVKAKLLDKPNTDTYLVKGYDADSFFLKLNTELQMPRPDILDRPFSHLKKLHESVVDIQQDSNLKEVYERMTITSKWIQNTIKVYEQLGGNAISKVEIQIDALKLNLINRIIENKFDNIVEVEHKINNSSTSSDYTDLLSMLYNNWGVIQFQLAKTKSGKEAESLFIEAIAKYRRAIEIKPNYDEVYTNLGVALQDLGIIQVGGEVEDLYIDVISKHQRATEIKPDNYKAFNNWGVALYNFARIKSNLESETLNDAISKYQKAIEINSDYHDAYSNCGAALATLAEMKLGAEKETLYEEAISKFQRATEIKLQNETYNNWGKALNDLAKIKSGTEAELLLKDSISKFWLADEIKPNTDETYNGWGLALSDLAGIKAGFEAEEFYNDAIKKYQQAIELNTNHYRAYNNWGIALYYLAKTKHGSEADKFYSDAIKKYQQAIKINADYRNAYINWNTTLITFSRTKSGLEQEQLLGIVKNQAEKVYQLYDDSYNLACVYALLNKTTEALHYLKETLIKDRITVEHVIADSDWQDFSDKEALKALLNEFKK